MDFSRYGHASPEWLSFLAANPSAAHEGFSGNEPDQAVALRNKSNEARSQTSARIIAEEQLDRRVEMATVAIPSRQDHVIPLRIYRPKDCPEGGPSGVVLYFHGGGLLFGDETTDDLICCRIAAATGTIVVSVIYRHTDKHQHPAQVDDAWDAFQHVRDHADTIGIPIHRGLIVLGISAGCTLATSVVFRELEESRKSQEYKPVIRGALLAIPWLIHIDNYPMEVFRTPEASAKLQHAGAAVIPSARLELFSNLLGAQDVTDTLLNVSLLSQKELEGWPPTVLQVAGADPLRDDGLLFAEKLETMR
jgi:acetyl esterase/lipase